MILNMHVIAQVDVMNGVYTSKCEDKYMQVPYNNALQK